MELAMVEAASRLPLTGGVPGWPPISMLQDGDPTTISKPPCAEPL
jgi:hypothetical protein